MPSVRKRLFSLGLGLGICSAGLFGCQNQPAPVTVKSGSDAPAAAASDTATDMLSSALYQLQPENLGIDSNSAAAVSVLNSWREQTSLIQVDQYDFTAETLGRLPPTLLTDAQRQRMLATEFFPSDATYIRNALLTAAMARSIADRQTSELDRVMALFECTLRTVTLQPSSIPQLPFPFYEILLIGQGTPDDRAWVFAALLKQQRIDAVVLQSQEDPAARLVGVILEGEVYLFDTKLGLPIPRGDDPPSVRITRPATFKEMQAHPEWWQAMTLRADQPYPWTAEQLASAEVHIIADEEAWSGRMKQLQTVLPADSLCALYDPLVDTPLMPALPQRILAGHSDWSTEKLRFWSHPLSVPERAKQFGPQGEQLRAFFERFKVPMEIKSSQQKNEVTQDELVGRAARNPNQQIGPDARLIPSQQHLKTRTEHLMGEFATATTHYLRIRHLAVEKPPLEMHDPQNPQVFQLWMTLYQIAASDASFWSAVCKWEVNDPNAAVAAFRDYIKKYPRSDWTSAARYLMAIIQAELGQLGDARATVSTIPTEDVHRPGLEILMKRWDGLTEKQADETPKSGDDAPSTTE